MYERVQISIKVRVELIAIVHCSVGLECFSAKLECSKEVKQ